MKNNIITVYGVKYGNYILTPNSRRYYLDTDNILTQFFANQKVAYWGLVRTNTGQYRIVGRILA